MTSIGKGLRLAGFAAAAVLATAMAPARAGVLDFWDKDVTNCASSDPDVAMAACTSRIKSLLVRGGDKAVAFNNRAQAHMRKGEYTAALADLNQAIPLNPKSPQAFYNRGVTYTDGLAMPDRAIPDFTQAITLKAESAPKGPPSARDFPEALNYRGLAQQALGRYDLAVQDFTAALRLSPKFGPALANRGAAYAAQRKYPAALHDQSAALALDGSVSSRWSARCWTKLKMASKSGPPDVPALDAAQSDCAKALILDAANADARNGQGAIKLMLNEPADALADFQAVLATDKQNSVALFGRGIAKRQIGDTAGGETDMTNARTLSPQASTAFWEAKIIPNP